MPLTGDLASNPGMCPDWESNHDPLIHRPVLNPLSYTSQGWTGHLNTDGQLPTLLETDLDCPASVLFLSASLNSFLFQEWATLALLWAFAVS